MAEPFHEPLTVWRFIRRYFVRIVIGAVLVVAVYGALLVMVEYQTYQREQRIATEIQAYGGYVQFVYAGPDWIPQSMRDRTALFSRVMVISLTNTAGLEHLKELTDLGILSLDGIQVTDSDLEHLKGLTNLYDLRLDATQVTDAGLEHLKGLTNLYVLTLGGMQVTDNGLVHLKGLTNLVLLEIGGTQVTPEGRAMLRKALPNCVIRWIRIQ